jgi:hypothetical protein
MGTRIAFFETTNGKSLKENFVENYPDFKTWTLQYHKNSLEVYNEPLISDTVEQFLKTHDTLRVETLEQPLLDTLLLEFFVTYCDHGNGQKLVALFGPLVGVHNYRNSFKIIPQQNDKTLTKIWNVLKDGRSLYNNNSYTVNCNTIIGFWTKDEMEYLKDFFKKTPKIYDIGIECIEEVLAQIGKGKEELVMTIEL